MLFVPGQLYTYDDWFIRIGDHDLTEICRTDARFLGSAVEHLLQMQFRNLHRTPRPGGRSADLIEDHPDGFRIWEAKTTKGNRINVQQSHAKGKGRKHDPERWFNYLESLYGFVLVDQRRLPTVSFRGVSIAEIRAKNNGDVPKNPRIDIIYRVSS